MRHEGDVYPNNFLRSWSSSDSSEEGDSPDNSQMAHRVKVLFWAESAYLRSDQHLKATKLWE
jgi:hypothetical protein